MHDTLFSACVLTGGDLRSERGLRVVMAVDGESLPRVAIRATVLKGWSELEQTDEVLIVVLILAKEDMSITTCQVSLHNTSVYCPGTSISSHFPYWNSSKWWLSMSSDWTRGRASRYRSYLFLQR